MDGIRGRFEPRKLSEETSRSRRFSPSSSYRYESSKSPIEQSEEIVALPDPSVHLAGDQSPAMHGRDPEALRHEGANTVERLSLEQRVEKVRKSQQEQTKTLEELKRKLERVEKQVKRQCPEEFEKLFKQLDEQILTVEQKKQKIENYIMWHERENIRRGQQWEQTIHERLGLLETRQNQQKADLIEMDNSLGKIDNESDNNKDSKKSPFQMTEMKNADSMINLQVDMNQFKKVEKEIEILRKDFEKKLEDLHIEMKKLEAYKKKSPHQVTPNPYTNSYNYNILVDIKKVEKKNQKLENNKLDVKRRLQLLEERLSILSEIKDGKNDIINSFKKKNDILAKNINNDLNNTRDKIDGHLLNTPKYKDELRKIALKEAARTEGIRLPKINTSIWKEFKYHLYSDPERIGSTPNSKPQDTPLKEGEILFMDDLIDSRDKRVENKERRSIGYQKIAAHIVKQFKQFEEERKIESKYDKNFIKQIYSILLGSRQRRISEVGSQHESIEQESIVQEASGSGSQEIREVNNSGG